MTRAVRLAGSVAVLAFGLGRIEAAEPLPYTLSLEVRYVDAGQSASLREDVERELLGSLLAEGCFQGVRLESASTDAPEADLLLRVSLGDVQDETRYDGSLAGSLNPDDPNAKMQFTTVFSTQVIQELLALPSGIEVRRSYFTARAERRPLVPEEDTRGWARAQMIRNLTKSVRSSVCGSQRKLQKKIDQARASGSTKR